MARLHGRRDSYREATDNSEGEGAPQAIPRAADHARRLQEDDGLRLWTLHLGAARQREHPREARRLPELPVGVDRVERRSWRLPHSDLPWAEHPAGRRELLLQLLRLHSREVVAPAVGGPCADLPACDNAKGPHLRALSRTVPATAGSLSRAVAPGGIGRPTAAMR